MSKHEAEMYATLLKKLDVLINRSRSDTIKGHLQCAKAEVLAAIQSERMP